jgi:hypothetical protein
METNTTATGTATDSTTTNDVGPNVKDPQDTRTHRYEALTQAKAAQNSQTGNTEGSTQESTAGSQTPRSTETEAGENNTDFWSAKVEGDAFDGTHKGVNWNDTVSGLPDDAQKLLANLRADYTKKTQDLARQRKALESERKALLNEDYLANINEKANQEIQFDPFDNDSVNARIEQEVAKRMQQMIQPLQQEYELQQRQMALDNFKSAHPDLQDYKTEIAKLLMTDQSLNLERAYYIVKGKANTDKAAAYEKELQTYKQAAREYGLKVGGGRINNPSNNIPEQVKKGGPYEIYKWLQGQKRNG